MPTTDAEDADLWSKGTKQSGDKLAKKYTAAASKTLNRLKDPATQKTWEEKMADEATKKAYEAGRNNVTEKDLVDGMTQKGKQNYITSTGTDAAKNAYMNNGREYRAAAKEFSANKPRASNFDEAMEIAKENARIQANIRRRKLGLPEV